ncbi:cysteine proteinase [Massarina eburnea CBS 473.64]|uniref:Cysteine proteinase n=1 Tax=Massarina eburnea CBS 473.64 TaxID=1395130 RepID=A0A6A6RZT6_9PLEO|nr:cysteine proteinase [Massarina eburnea CBS 473.64]
MSTNTSDKDAATKKDQEDNRTKKPQEKLNDFWTDLVTQKPSKVTNIFPPRLYTNLLPPKQKRGTVKGKNAAESYKAAVEKCRDRVKRIVKECHRNNEKFTDPDFDIEEDWNIRNCLDSLMVEPDSRKQRSPGTVHRVDWIFDDPSFTIDGFSSSGVNQGAVGDCWFIAALSTICSKPNLMEKVCVAKDEECGAYGFVFFRDGEWVSTVVDDNLYLTHKDYSGKYDPTGVKEAKHKKHYQTGSEALYFGSCTNQNETWLPLLEKAYAKIHGDFESIDGGQTGEGVEDLTGGVNTVIKLNRVLSKDKLWKELLDVNEQFLFAAISLDASDDARHGLQSNHTYSILRAVEAEDEQGQIKRLLLVRNPWGKPPTADNGEWNGPWSDGSKEWTPYWLQKLSYSFDSNGTFWMAYEDVLRRFQELDRTRLFDKDWTVVQRWTSSGVAWVTGYLNTKFMVEIKKGGPTVFMLTQLDERYFKGLHEKYSFDLHFILKEEGSPSGEYIVRARCPRLASRGVSAEVDLEPGKYEVVPKIVATRDSDELDVHKVVAKVASKKPQKLRQIGMNYDIAHAKANVVPTAAEKEAEKEKKLKMEKEKADFAAFQKDKLEFEAWQKAKKDLEEKKREEKAREEEREEKDQTSDEESTAETETAKENDPEGDDEIKSDDDEKIKKETENVSEVECKMSGETEPAESKAKIQDTPVQDSPVQDMTTRDAPAEKNTSPPRDSPEPDTTDEGKGKKNEDEKAKDDYQNPWNAVCVFGLRVYSKDEEVTIRLVKPKAEEAASLAADGSTQAGATM